MHDGTAVLGDPRLPERFWKFVTVVDCGYRTPCWLFKIHVGGMEGYKLFSIGKRGMLAHRHSYTVLVGEIPPKFTIDHLCRERACVNPGHLEAVTHAVNNARSNGPSAINSRRTECVNGHPYDEKNTFTRRDGRRDCRACMRDRANAYGAAQREKRKLAGTYRPPGWNGNKDVTHCPKGHEYTPENILRKGKDGTGRACRECNRVNSLARYYASK